MPTLLEILILGTAKMMIIIVKYKSLVSLNIVENEFHSLQLQKSMIMTEKCLNVFN